MYRFRACAIVAIIALSAASIAAAGDAPPIKPGLWLVTMDLESNGQKMPDTSAMMDKMPPEMRAKMAAMMKDRGVDMSGGAGGTRICMTRESLDKGNWQNAAVTCTTTYGLRTSTHWKWHSVCTKPELTSDGEADFTDPDNYTVKTSSVMKMMGDTRATQHTVHSKWLGPNCGDLKPISELMKKP